MVLKFLIILYGVYFVVLMRLIINMCIMVWVSVYFLGESIIFVLTKILLFSQ